MHVFLKVFLGSILLSFMGIISYSYLFLAEDKSKLVFTPLKDKVFVTSQISANDIKQIKQKRFFTVVDIRPDGEVADQISSAEMQNISKQANIEFHYLPVQKSVLPMKQAAELADIIQQSSNKVLLYCRSGNRATRTYALALAMTPNGPSLNEINTMVNQAGFSVADIQTELTQLIDQRG